MNHLPLMIKAYDSYVRSVRLPMKGRVLVRTGDQLQAGDPIAEVRLTDRYLVYDVVNNLKINPQEMDKRVQRLVGESFKKGDVLAQKPGIISRLFRATEDGKVISVQDGKMVLALGERVEKALAPFPGRVVDLLPDRGAVIAAQGLILQGEWGNGLHGAGKLVWYPQTGEEKIPEADLAGAICFVEGNLSLGKLNKLLRFKPAGLVITSCPLSLIEAFEKVSIPVIALVGFGEYALDSLSEDLLKQMDGQYVYLLADEVDALEGSRPTLLMLDQEVLEQPGLVSSGGKELIPGCLVRLIGRPYTGQVGKVVELPEQAERFASGRLLPAVVVEREDGQKVRLPRSNVCLISN
ncbi:MAG: hypothetical protein ACOYKD_05690 [Anaerolineaceae bacterium]|jgi:hypothetical protein